MEEGAQGDDDAGKIALEAFALLLVHSGHCYSKILRYADEVCPLRLKRHGVLSERMGLVDSMTCSILCHRITEQLRAAPTRREF